MANTGLTPELWERFAVHMRALNGKRLACDRIRSQPFYRAPHEKHKPGIMWSGFISVECAKHRFIP